MEKVFKYVVAPVGLAAFYYAYWVGTYKLGETIGTFLSRRWNGPYENGNGGRRMGGNGNGGNGNGGNGNRNSF